MMSWPRQMGAGVPSQGPDCASSLSAGRDWPVATVVPAMGDASNLGRAQAPVGTHTYAGSPTCAHQAPKGRAASPPHIGLQVVPGCQQALCPHLPRAVADNPPGARAHLNSTDDPRKEPEMLSSQVKVRVMSEL